MFDATGIRRSVSLSEVAGQFGVQLKRQGSEWWGCCPFHAEDTPSFSVFTGRDGVQRFECFGCGTGGDVIQFVQDLKGVGFRDACEILGGKADAPENRAPIALDTTSVYDGIEPERAEEHPFAVRKMVKVYNPKRVAVGKDGFAGITPSMVFEYRSTAGDLLGLVLRREIPGGRKETPTVRFVRLPDGTTAWARYPFDVPRPIYRLDKMAGGQVIVAEGEKAADALAAATGRSVVSWPGGGKSVGKVDWSPLAGRDVILWPDADKPGLDAMLEIAKLLQGVASRVRFVDVPLGGEGGPYTVDQWQGGAPAPDGWDAADAVADGWSKADLDAFMRSLVRDGLSSMPAEAKVEEPTRPTPTPTPRHDPSPDPKPEPVKQMRPTEQAQPGEVVEIRSRKRLSPDETWRAELLYNEEGRPKPKALHNWMMFLQHHEEMRGVLEWNEFTRRLMLSRCPPWCSGEWSPRPVDDTDTVHMAAWLERKGLSPTVGGVASAAAAAGQENRVDPLETYLRRLKWDGVQRLRTWLHRYIGAADNDYHSIVGRKFMISAVARALRPGCKVDTMVILEGRQGAMKSSAWRTLFGTAFFSDHISDPSSKDAMIEVQGVWAVEVAEMHRFSAADANAVKKFLTTQIDRYRPPYGRSLVEAPRRSVMVGTVNPDGSGYLKDPTGARRFWPVKVGSIDIKALAADRDQLWAEAVVAYDLGNPWWLAGDETDCVEAEQAARRLDDPWSDTLAAKLLGRTQIFQNDVLLELGITNDKANEHVVQRVGRVMRSLGWRSTRVRDFGVLVRKYVKADLLDE